ncbi:MAG: aldo/keto reductase [Chloroflexi bacterium]|nr:MAG: aldo/keto reductase [Chloroflexota bacterium]TMG67117.1 MAG: aldo/keto reductase [Chloroflexota bacterium]
MNPTERVKLGPTSLQVTRLGFGTAPLGGLFQALADDEAHRVVEAAWSAGIRFFDTAPQYGNGLAEQRLGTVLRAKPRDQFVLATKVGRLLRAGAPPQSETFPDAPPLNPVFDFSYDGVMRSVEESVARLGIERIDILHIHDPDDHFAEALSEAYPALDRLRAEGTITAVGAGMNQAEMLARFAREANFDCFLLAGRYTLLDQVGLKELLPLCAERGIAIIAGGVFNSGILADPTPGTHYNYKAAPDELVQRAGRIKAVCERHGVSQKAAAIQFPLGHPAVQTVLTGCRSVDELNENVEAFQAPIPPAAWDELKADGLLVADAPVP